MDFFIHPRIAITKCLLKAEKHKNVISKGKDKARECAAAKQTSLNKSQTNATTVCKNFSLQENAKQKCYTHQPNTRHTRAPAQVTCRNTIPMIKSAQKAKTSLIKFAAKQ